MGEKKGTRQMQQTRCKNSNPNPKRAIGMQTNSVKRNVSREQRALREVAAVEAYQVLRPPPFHIPAFRDIQRPKHTAPAPIHNAVAIKPGHSAYPSSICASLGRDVDARTSGHGVRGSHSVCGAFDADA